MPPFKVDDASAGMWGDVTDSVSAASLTLNGHSRFPDSLPGLFFRQVQPALKWPNTPAGYTYLFTFAALGGVWNPTSTLNMSRIDHVQLELKYGANIPTSDVIVFNEAYNLLVNYMFQALTIVLGQSMIAKKVQVVSQGPIL